MFCPNCGTKNDDDALFCGSCGTKLQDKAVVPPVDNDFKPDIELVQAEVQNGAQAYAQPEPAKPQRKTDSNAKMRFFE